MWPGKALVSFAGILKPKSRQSAIMNNQKALSNATGIQKQHHVIHCCRRTIRLDVGDLSTERDI